MPETEKIIYLKSLKEQGCAIVVFDASCRDRTCWAPAECLSRSSPSSLGPSVAMSSRCIKSGGRSRNSCPVADPILHAGTELCNTYAWLSQQHVHCEDVKALVSVVAYAYCSIRGRSERPIWQMLRPAKLLAISLSSTIPHYPNGNRIVLSGATVSRSTGQLVSQGPKEDTEHMAARTG